MLLYLEKFDYDSTYFVKISALHRETKAGLLLLGPTITTMPNSLIKTL